MPLRVSAAIPSSEATVTEASSPVICPVAALNVPVPPAFQAVTCARHGHRICVRHSELTAS
jgi:hypothetical protein